MSAAPEMDTGKRLMQAAPTVTGFPGDCVMLGVKPDKIDSLSPIVWETLARSVDHAGGTCTVEDLKPLYKSEDAQLWLIVDAITSALVAVISTEIGVYPREKALVIGFCAGAEMERWLSYLVPLEEWAKGKGCTLSEPHGRRGWGRVLKDYGYEEAYTVFRKRL